MTNEPDSTGADTGAGTGSQNTAANQSRAFAPRPSLGRGFGAYTHPQVPASPSESGYSPVPASRKNYTPAGILPDTGSHRSPIQSRKHLLSWLMPRRSKQTPAPDPSRMPTDPVESRRNFHPAQQPFAGAASPYASQPYPLSPQLSPDHSSQGYPLQAGERFAEAQPDGYEGGLLEEQTSSSPDVSPVRVWERQPYAFLAHLLLASGAIATAWVLGILAAQVLPGRFSAPPLQESLLRKTSRLTHRLWHFPQLWHTPTTQVRIDAIPLPETGPILGPVVLSPIERQPLIDELNAVETEILTLDRRLQSLEKRLGRPPYQGTGIESRINTMRAAIDPPVRSTIAPEAYEPVVRQPSDTLLEVAKLAITLPGDALFTPGESDLKDAALLERVLDQLVGYPEATISVRVHSDDYADAIATREYTLAQANTLARYLQNNLPTAHRWITVGMGAAQPVTESVDVVQRQRNRRIEILVDTR